MVSSSADQVEAYIGLGSNLQDPVAQVTEAIRSLDDLPHSHCSAYSSLYRSAPMGPQDQPDYINAVAQLQTRLSPVELLDALQQIEQQHGRVRARRWGARTLDLDLLLYGDLTIQTERLNVPHPGLCQRAFVLVPLHEVAGDIQIPGQGGLARLVSDAQGDALTRL